MGTPQTDHSAYWLLVQFTDKGIVDKILAQVGEDELLLNENQFTTIHDHAFAWLCEDSGICSDDTNLGVFYLTQYIGD